MINIKGTFKRNDSDNKDVMRSQSSVPQTSFPIWILLLKLQKDVHNPQVQV